MKATLNITLQGISADYALEVDGPLASLGDRDVKRIALEVVRCGAVPGLHIAGLPEDTFDDFVVDRFNTPEGGARVFLRPKVPFGHLGVWGRSREAAGSPQCGGPGSARTA